MEKLSYYIRKLIRDYTKVHYTSASDLQEIAHWNYDRLKSYIYIPNPHIFNMAVFFFKNTKSLPIKYEMYLSLWKLYWIQYYDSDLKEKPKQKAKPIKFNWNIKWTKYTGEIMVWFYQATDTVALTYVDKKFNPIATISTCLSRENIQKHQCFIDTNNLWDDIIWQLMNQNVISYNLKWHATSWFCIYPLCDLSPEVTLILKEMGDL